MRFVGDDVSSLFVGSHVGFAIELPDSLHEVQEMMQVADVSINPIYGHIIRKSSLTLQRSEYAVLFTKHCKAVTLMARLLDPRPISPWRNPNLEHQIIQLTANYRGDAAGVGRQNIDRWLSQFDGAARCPMLHLLEVMCRDYLFTSNRCNQLARELFAKMLHHVNGNAHRIRIVTLGAESRGGGYVKYLVRVVNNLPVRLFPATTDALLSDCKEGNADMVAFVDDFCGTGDTAIGAVNRICRELDLKNRLGKQVSLVACCLVGFSDAIEQVKQTILANNPKQPIQECCFAAKSLSDEDHIFRFDHNCILHEDVRFSSDSWGRRFFASAKDARTVYKEFCKHALFYPDGVPRPLGYGNLASPVVFFYNTPNNAPAALWYMGKEWQPVLPRRSVRDYGGCDPPQHPYGKSVGEQSSEMATRFEKKNPVVILHGPPGSGKFLVASDVTRKVMSSRNVFWFECTEHSTADCLRNQLEEYCDQCLPDENVGNQVKNAISAAEKNETLISYIIRLAPLVVFHHLDFALERNDDSPILDEQRQLIRDILAKCRGSVAFLLTASSAETVKKKLIPGMNRPKLECPKQVIQYYFDDILDGYKEYFQVLQERIDNGSISAAAAVLALLLFRDNKIKAGIMKDVPEETVLETFYKTLPEPHKHILLCAAAIRSHRTDDLLGKLESIVYTKPRDIKAVSSTTKEFSEKWQPILYRDDQSGVLAMSDSLRAYLYKEKILDDSAKTPLWHEAIAAVYRDLEANDWAEKIQFVAISTDHCVKSGKPDCLITGAMELLALRPFFNQHAKLHQYAQFVSLVRGTMLEHMERSTGSKKVSTACMKLHLELLRVHRRYSEYDRVEALCEEISTRPRWAAGREELTRVELYRSVLAAVCGDYELAERCAGHATETVYERGDLKVNGGNDLPKDQAGSIVRCLLRQAQCQMSLSDYYQAAEQLETAAEIIKKTWSSAGSDELVRHNLAVLTRHLSTLFYLDCDAIPALRWAQVSRSLNRELEDLEGEAVSLIKVSQAWSLLGDRPRALATAKRAEEFLLYHVPRQKWWMLGVYKARCLAWLRHFRLTSQDNEPNPKAASMVLGKVKAQTKHMKELLKGIDQKWFAPWRLEPHILEAEAHMVAGRMKAAKREWTIAWGMMKTNGGEVRNAPQARSLLSILGRAMKEKKIVLSWMPNQSPGAGNREWFHYAIDCFMRAVDILTRSQLFYSQDWHLRQIRAVAGISEIQNDDYFVNLARHWSIHRSHLRDQLTAGRKDSTDNWLTTQGTHGMGSYSSSIDQLLTKAGMNELTSIEDDCRRFTEMQNRCRGIEELLLELVIPADIDP